MTRDEMLALAEHHEVRAEVLLDPPLGGLNGAEAVARIAEAADRIVCAKFLRELAEQASE